MAQVLENSLIIPGQIAILSWSPAQPAVTQAQGHWSVQQGNLLLDVNFPGARDILADHAFRLFEMDPHDGIYYNLRMFNWAAQNIINHCGYIDDTSFDRDGPAAWRSILFASDLLHTCTQGSLNHPNGLRYFPEQVLNFFGNLRASQNYANEIAHREANGIIFDEFDPLELWWKAGMQVRRETGYRLSYLRVGVRKTPLECLLSWMDRVPARRLL